ncbi:hypothetical protein [Mycobacterium sp. 48b]|uniref:hypothetical protein n=1 Tax=Mycobacterium sp. 48b TaxID=3400426 RepID=UPI003AAF0674
MLRTALAAAAVVCSLGLIGAPTAAADQAGKTRSENESSQTAPKVSAPKLRVPVQKKLAGHPAGDWRAAKKRTMDRYFEQRREQGIQNIYDWFDQR